MGVTAYCACCCPLASIPKGLWTKLYHSQLPTFIYSPRQHHPLPSFLFFWFPSFFPSFLVSPPSPSDYCSVYQSFGRLTHQAMQEVRLALLGFKKKKKKKDRQKKKEAPPKSYWARCLLTHWPPGVDVVVFVCRCILRQQVKTAYCNTSISTKFSNSFLCSVYCISSSVSFHLPPLVWSVTKFLARLHC